MSKFRHIIHECNFLAELYRTEILYPLMLLAFLMDITVTHV